MIELALVAGAKLRWRYPGTQDRQPKDGIIVRSVTAANTMTYLGSTQPLPRRAPHRYMLNQPIPHAWLDYIPGRTSYISQTQTRHDVLTGFMSGCLIARGTYNGQMSVFHLGTSDNIGISNLVKEAFRKQAPNITSNLTGFYPDKAWTINEIGALAAGKATKILALVTSAGSFYSILLRHDNNDWIVGDIRAVPPLNRVGLMVSLFK